MRLADFFDKDKFFREEESGESVVGESVVGNFGSWMVEFIRQEMMSIKKHQPMVDPPAGVRNQRNPEFLNRLLRQMKANYQNQ
jgi:hypothetical protein